MQLSERKRKILNAVVNENIKNAEPVSSGELHKKYMQDISSATIRNELLQLEELGLLSQKHASSGRVPTTIGFKKYIEELLEDKAFSNKEIEELKLNFEEKIDQLEELATETAKVISEKTQLASIVYFNLCEEATIKSVKIVNVDADLNLAIVVTDLGVINDISFKFGNKLSEQDYIAVSGLLTDLLGGKKISEVTNFQAETVIENQLAGYKTIFNAFIEAVALKSKKDAKITVDGTSNLLNLPEYSSVDKIRKTLELFENKEALPTLLSCGNNLEISVNIGADDKEDMSVVSVAYKINGKTLGKAGVVGPVRMDYKKAISVLKDVNKTVYKNINERNKKRKKTD